MVNVNYLKKEIECIYKAEKYSVRVHRIVATAYHGEPPKKEHIVNHIDTNKIIVATIYAG